MAVTRRRLLSDGTVGGRMPWTNTPWSSSAAESAIVAPGGPIKTGTIGVTPGSVQ
jgi:hypothetical protein